MLHSSTGVVASAAPSSMMNDLDDGQCGQQSGGQCWQQTISARGKIVKLTDSYPVGKFDCTAKLDRQKSVKLPAQDATQLIVAPTVPTVHLDVVYAVCGGWMCGPILHLAWLFDREFWSSVNTFSVKSMGITKRKFAFFVIFSHDFRLLFTEDISSI